MAASSVGERGPGVRGPWLLQRLSSRAQARWRCTGLVALWHVGSSQIRDRTMSSALAGRFFAPEPPGKPPFKIIIVTILVDGKWYFIVVLICISVMANII